MAEKQFTVRPIFRGFKASITISLDPVYYAAVGLDLATAGVITASIAHKLGDDPLFLATTADNSIERDETDPDKPILVITIPSSATTLFTGCSVTFGFILQEGGEATVVDGVITWPVCDPPAPNPLV